MQATLIDSPCEYEAFVDKFVAKKTTDDCYTPESVYDTVLRYVGEFCDIDGAAIIRPFFPGGDFERAEYPTNCVVIDNPPFSILSRITRFYLDKGIRFFLFAPHTTLFSSHQNMTYLVVGADITYENGAIVKTSFCTNIMGSVRIMGCPILYGRLEAIAQHKAASLPKYKYPPNVLTVSRIAKLVKAGVSVQVEAGSVFAVRGLDAQRAMSKAIFGSGFLVSGAEAREIEAREIEAREIEAREIEASTIEWKLSEREQQIIDLLI